MFCICVLIIAAAAVYMVEAYIHTYYAIEYMHGAPLFFVLLAKYAAPVLFLLLCGYFVFRYREKRRESEKPAQDKPENREEVYAEKINVTVKTKAVFSDQADQMLYQVKRFGQKMAVAYSMTQDSKTSGEQAKCLTLLASAERIFYDRLDDAIRSASMFDETEYKAFQQGIISFEDTDTAKKKQEIYTGIIKTINNVVHDNEHLILRLDSLAYALNQRSAQNPWDTDVVLAMSRLDDVISKTNQDLEQDGFNGLDDYTYTGKVYDGNTIAQAQSVWKEEKDSGIPIVAEFVVDTSGSMRGEPINALKTAMINTIQYINDDNYIGIIGFDSDVREYLPIDQFSLTQKTLYKGAVNSLNANGNTAMYNGLCVAMDRIYKKSQELGGNCTPIIFVLTDGDNNTGYEFSDTKNIIAGMDIPIYTISYNYAADSLSELASINEAAAIVGNSEDITYKLRNLFNAEM